MALIAEVERLKDSNQFTYVTAVTKLRGNAAPWEQNQKFRENLGGNPIKILTLQEVLSDLYSKTKTMVASSEVGPLLQVIKASGWNPSASVPISPGQPVSLPDDRQFQIAQKSNWISWPHEPPWRRHRPSGRLVINLASS
jgi:hypothetical protein